MQQCKWLLFSLLPSFREFVGFYECQLTLITLITATYFNHFISFDWLYIPIPLLTSLKQQTFQNIAVLNSWMSMVLNGWILNVNANASGSFIFLILLLSFWHFECGLLRIQFIITIHKPSHCNSGTDSSLSSLLQRALERERRGQLAFYAILFVSCYHLSILFSYAY